MTQPLSSTPPKKINFGLQENTCNMSCPKCLVHSDNYPRGIELRKSLGIMSVQNFIPVLDEIREFHPLVSPSFWGEPLLNKRLFQTFASEAQKRAMPVMVNTNGLLIDDQMAKFLVEHLSIISISIDAFSPEVLIKTRATDQLEKITTAVHRLLTYRGKQKGPRIVVSFSEEESNAHEKEQFVEYWLEHVDAIRINEVYDSGGKLGNVESQPHRKPCREIYDLMNIDFDGTVRMCCIDGYRETNLGNVFTQSVLDVWNGPKYQTLRQGHEGNGKLDSFCEGCDQWAGFNIIEEFEENGLLFRKTAHSTYINRLDRIENWTDGTKRRDF